MRAKLTKIVETFKTKHREYKVANEELGLGLLAQRRIIKLGKQLPACTDEDKKAQLKRRGERIVARGRAKVRARNARKCWIEVEGRERYVYVFAAIHGTGYPAEIPYEEAVRFAKMLNEHDGKQGIELTVQLGFGFQRIPLPPKVLPQARQLFNQVALDYCEQLIAERNTENATLAVY